MSSRSASALPLGAPSPAAATPPSPGAHPGQGSVIAGRYRLVEKLAEGGMGAVYRAEHVLSRKKLAVKVLHAHMQQGRNAVERFKREASAAAEIDHPGIVQIFDAGVDTDGTFYMAMELLEGESLGARMRRSWPGTRTSVEFMISICEPLAQAHAKGFVHRDLKPENIFVVKDEAGRERAKILDFGLVREVARSGPTMSGVTFGTPEYMAPEQALSAKRAGVPADVWSLGAMLYELLAGRHPFTGETANAVMANAIKDPLPPLATLAPHVPASLASLVERCLEKEAADRVPDAGALGAALREIVAGTPLDDRTPLVAVRTLGADESTGDSEDGRLVPAPGLPDALFRERETLGEPRERRRRWAIAGAGVVAIAALVVGVAWVVDRPGPGIVATALPGGPSEAGGAGPAPAVEAAVQVEGDGRAGGPSDVARSSAGAAAPTVGSVPSGDVSPGAASPNEADVPVAVGAPVEPTAASTAPDGAGPMPASPSASSASARPPRGSLARAVSSPPSTDGSVGLEAAQACMRRADLRCAVEALRDARSADELALLVEVHRAQGRATDARGVMQRYLRRFPSGADADAYRRELGLVAE